MGWYGENYTRIELVSENKMKHWEFKVNNNNNKKKEGKNGKREELICREERERGGIMEFGAEEQTWTVIYSLCNTQKKTFLHALLNHFLSTIIISLFASQTLWAHTTHTRERERERERDSISSALLFFYHIRHNATQFQKPTCHKTLGWITRGVKA